MFNLEKSISDWRRQMQAAGIKTSVPLEELEAHLRDDIDRLKQSGMSEETAFQISTRQMGQPQILNSEFKKNGIASGKRFGIFAVVVAVVMILRVLAVHRGMGPIWKNDQLGWILFSAIVLFWGSSTVFFNFTLGGIREVRLWKLIGITYSVIAIWISLLPILRIFTAPAFNAAFGTTDRILALAAAAASILSVFGWRICRGVLPVIHNTRTRTIIGIACCLSGPGVISLFFYFIFPLLGHFPAPLFLVLLAWMWTAMAILGGAGYGLAEAVEPRTDGDLRKWEEQHV
jgi:hypothetical protein